MRRARGFARDLMEDLTAAARLTVRCYPAVAGPVLAYALLHALTPPSRGGLDLSVVVSIAALMTWLWSSNRVYGVYVRRGTYAEGKRPATLREIAGAAWAVGWPALAFGVVALKVAAAVPHAYVAVNFSAVGAFLYALPFAVANLLAGWAFTYVVTDDARPGMAATRTYAAILRAAVALKAIAVAAVLLLASFALHAAASRAAHGLDGGSLQQWQVQQALLVAVDLLWWPFAYALVLTSRPSIDLATRAAAFAGPGDDLLQPPGSRRR